MNVLSLFNGIGCAMEAFKRARIHVDRFYACEVDRFANAINDYHFGDVTTHLGCVKMLRRVLYCADSVVERFLKSTFISEGKKEAFRRLVEMRDVKMDWVVGGPPCPSFSFAGKMNGFNDQRGELFFDFIKILDFYKARNPNLFFLAENVNMKAGHRNVLTNLIEVHPVRVNSNLVSAQNRDRLYWTNIHAVSVGLFADGPLTSIVPQPVDKGITLKDILEEEVDVKYTLSETAMERILRKSYSRPKIEPEKTGCINTKNNSGSLCVDGGTTLVGVLNYKGNIMESDKSNYHKGIDNHGQRTFIFQRGRGFNGGGEHFDKSPTLTSNSFQHNHSVSNYRRLTPVECERLQTLPDDFTRYGLIGYKVVEISDSQRYKCIGNAWTVDVITHILSFSKK